MRGDLNIIRFAKEFFSYIALTVVINLGGGAAEYYLLTTVMLYCSFGYYVYVHRGYHGLLFTLLFLVMLMLNPLTLILLETPRTVMAVSFFVFSMSIRNVIASRSFLIFSCLSHMAVGVFSLLFHYFIKVRVYYAVVGFAIVGFFLFFIGGDLKYAIYFDSSDDVRRGLGRLLLATASILFVLFISRFFLKLKLKIILVLLSLTLVFLITPFVHRLFYIPFVFVNLLYFSSSPGFYCRFFFVLHNLFMVVLGLLIVYFGMYGYG